MTHIQIVVLLSFAIAMVVLGFVSLVMKVSAACKAKAYKLPYPIGQLPFSEEEMGKPVTTIRNAEEAKWPVYWFDGPIGREQKRFGTLLRLRGRRAIIRLENGRRVRRKAYLVHLMDGTRLDVPPVREPRARKLAETLSSAPVMEVTSESSADPALATMLDLEHRHGAVPAELSA